MSKKQIKIGQIVRPFKISGELKVKCFTDIPQERFKVGSTIILKYLNQEIETKVLTFRMHQDHALITCDHIKDRTEAEKYRFVVIDKKVDVDPKRITLSDLEGCIVYNFNESIGVVIQALSYPAHNIIRVKLHDEREIMIPYVDQFIKKVDVESSTIHCELIEGFL
jgi:16S rRNA processing protein RimM